MPNIHTYTIGAYTPYYDAKQLAEPSVVAGKNFMPTTSGYKSEFGGTTISDRKIPTKLLLNGQLFSLHEDALVLCNRYGIYRFDTTSEGWYLLAKADFELTTDYPWSVAYVGGDWFFCKLGFGVWRYRIDENSGMFVKKNVPSEPLSICSAGGRLVILGSSTYAWSAIGDGTDLATSLETGAGFQALSLIGGKPLAVKSNTIGFMVYTTAGIVRVEAIDTPNPYQHKVLTTSDYAPVSAWAITEIGTGSHIFLAKSGLYATSGDYPQILEKDFSKWLTGTNLRYLLQSIYKLPICLSYDATHRWIILSQGDYSVGATPYSLAYCLDIELGKWGRYDRNHYFASSVFVPLEKFKGYKFVTANPDGAIRVLDKDYGWTLLADQNQRNNYPVSVRPSYLNYLYDIDDNIYEERVFTSGAQIETYDWTKLGHNSEILGTFVYKIAGSSLGYELTMPQGFQATYFGWQEPKWFYIDMTDSSYDHVDMLDALYSRVDMEDNLVGSEGTTFTAYAVTDTQFVFFQELTDSGDLADLESELDIGLYHIPDFDDLQCSTVITGFAQMHEQTNNGNDVIDMMSIQDAHIDMSSIPDTTVDMGMGFLSSPNYRTTLISSSDGYGHRKLHEYVIEPYSIVGDRFNYNSYSTGLYHGFKLETVKAGGYYHLKQIQINIIQGGLIYDGA